jgi:hypothetical protein
MTFHSDKEIKEKWLKQYQEEMLLHREKMDLEKNNKLKQEQEEMKKLNKELEEENMKKQFQKRLQVHEDLNEYYKHLEGKRSKDMQNQQEKLERNSTTIELNSEERLNGLKEHIKKLSENVDKNMQKYLDYQNGNPDKQVNFDINNPSDSLNTDFRQNQNQNYYPSEISENIFQKPVTPKVIQGQVTRTDITSNDMLERIYNKNYNEYKLVT